MKTVAKGILTTLFLALFVSTAFSQKGVEDGSKYGHGEDSIRCLRNLSLYREYFKQDNYDFAKDPWKVVYSECPRASKNIYLDGEDMLQKAIEGAENDEEKMLLLDSLMNLYDQRIKYYGQKGFVMSKKSVDFIKEAPKTIENMQKGYDMLKETIKLRGKNSGPRELVTFMQTSNLLFSSNVIEGGQVVEDYATIMEVVDHILKKDPEESNMLRAKEVVDKVFESSGAASCENLIQLYKPKYAENSDDLDLLSKMHDMLDKTKCNESDFYFEIATQLNTLEPSADLASELARINSDKENYETAARLYKQAVEMETDSLKKSKYYLELGDITYRKLGNHSLARTYALKAADLDPSSGYPYMLIGHIYVAASKSCGEDEFQQKAVYWAAVDKFAQAKRIDPSLATDANKYIEAYSQYFPDGETIFFYGFDEGSTYTVGCWINETTTVRSR